MAKINEKEYEILKDLGVEWNWIARNNIGVLDCYMKKPKKYKLFLNLWSDNISPPRYIDGTNFQFIQWEDEEPYEIAELIDEYEKEYHIKNVKLDASEIAGNASDYKHFYKRLGESEETEVKKDLKWLKNEVQKIPVKSYGFNVLKEKDEYMVDIDEVIRLINQLDEQEVLSLEWIDDNKEMYLINDTSENAVPDYKLQNLLVPKQELLVIPKFVADFLTGIEGYYISDLFDYNLLYDENDKIARWLYGNDKETNKERELSLILAHYGKYTVEEEQKYYVLGKDDRTMLVRKMDGKTITTGDLIPVDELRGTEKEAHALTEKEIKDYDERYVPFMIPVEEVDNE